MPETIGFVGLGSSRLEESTRAARTPVGEEDERC
jgi:hypothetical protein